MTRHSQPWIINYATKTAPLRALMKDAWTDEAENAFQALKGDMRSAPALGNPDYTKPFHLYVVEKSGYATALLMQDMPTGKQPLAYYNKKLDNTESGLPPCYRGLATDLFAFKKASSMTMGHPVMLYTSHQLRALLTGPQFVLSQARRTGYKVIFSAPELTIQCCATVNPATKMVTPEDGTPHDCVQKTKDYMRVQNDLHNQPITDNKTEQPHKKKLFGSKGGPLGKS